MSTQNITSLDGLSYEAIHSSVLQNIFSYLKIFKIQSRKSITIEQKMNITNFINIYTYMYIYICIYICIPILHVAKMTQNKNDSINSCY